MSIRGQFPFLSDWRHIDIRAVVARIRPLLDKEMDKDTIVHAESSNDGQPTIVRIPNPKNESEDFSFMFNSVYDMETTQEELFTNEGTLAAYRQKPHVLMNCSCA